MECYKERLTGLQADYVLKKYKSHRAVSDFIFENINELINSFRPCNTFTFVKNKYYKLTYNKIKVNFQYDNHMI